jgi:hypothetical protein
MRVRVLESAKEHLIEGFHFYEEQEAGLGTYFLDSLSPTLTRFPSTAVFIRSFSVFTARFPTAFPSPSITSWQPTR